MFARILRSGLSSLAVLVVTSCASMQVRSDYDERASFSQLKTYAWMDRAEADREVDDPALEGGIVERASATRSTWNSPGAGSARRMELRISGSRTTSVADKKVSVQTVDQWSYRYYGYRRRFYSPRYYGYLGPGSYTTNYAREYRPTYGVTV
jgi:hypothetical protein